MRRICAIDGPCRYGEGSGEDLRVQGEIVPCRPMSNTHEGVQHGDDGSAVTIDDFEAFLGHLRVALADAGLVSVDVNVVADTLRALCPDIVSGGEGCADGLFERLGGEEGVNGIVADLIDRLFEDPKVSPYFRNLSSNIPHIQVCLSRKLAVLAGSTEHLYPGPGDPADDDGCRNMSEAHAGLGISTLDWNDYLANLAEALEAAGASTKDVEIIVSRASEAESAIVEDASNDSTLYQRLGRRPGIDAVVTALVEGLLAHDTIKGFFAETDRARLEVCLFRWICALDGPCVYGEGTAPALSIEYVLTACRPISLVHQGLTNPADGSPIGYVLFSSFMDLLTDALITASTAEPERAPVREGFEGQCSSVVTDGQGCN